MWNARIFLIKFFLILVLDTYLEDYLTMLRVEKNLSTNSITSYKTDLKRYINFWSDDGYPERINYFKESIQNKSFFQVGKKNQWKDKLSKEQTSKIENKFKKQMIKFNYEIS